MHQDAHEFLNFLLNSFADELRKQQPHLRAIDAAAPNSAVAGAKHEQSPISHDGLIVQESAQNVATPSAVPGGDGKGVKLSTKTPKATWIHELFEGILTNETRCLCCESVCDDVSVRN